MFKKVSTIIALAVITLLSTGLFFFKLNSSPPCLNADEASNGYSAYSILTTYKDEYGSLIPLRFKSFGDYKLPLLTYLAIPWIKIFGLNEVGIRMANFPFVLLFPTIVFLFTYELFKKKNYSLIASLLVGFTPGIQLLGRQAHEGYMTAFFITLASLFFVKTIKKQNLFNSSLFFLTLLISLFGYHSSRLWFGFYFIIALFFVFKKQLKKIIILGFLSILLLFGITDLIYSPTRIKSLLFFNNIGFSLKINELRAEGGSRLVYNKFTVGAKDLIFEYLKYFSPQFLVIQGDENIRFGFTGVSPITIIEYIFLFVGLYYLFKNKEKWRYLIILLLLFSPVSACLSWAGLSVTRSIFIFIPILVISSYGIGNFLSKENISNKTLRTISFVLFILIYFIFSFYSWDFYLNHYPKRATTIRAWQCGYKELTNFIKENYYKYDRFYITRKNGQPYIYLLFYLQYSPASYQQQAQLSLPDEYGFGQVENFDKFSFDLNQEKINNSLVIGFPDDFSNEDTTNYQKITVGTETIFLIKEIK